MSPDISGTVARIWQDSPSRMRHIETDTVIPFFLASTTWRNVFIQVKTSTSASAVITGMRVTRITVQYFVGVHFLDLLLGSHLKTGKGKSKYYTRQDDVHVVHVVRHSVR